MLWPGFEPGSVTREATILDRTILPEPVYVVGNILKSDCINLLSPPKRACKPSLILLTDLTVVASKSCIQN